MKIRIIEQTNRGALLTAGMLFFLMSSFTLLVAQDPLVVEVKTVTVDNKLIVKDYLQTKRLSTNTATINSNLTVNGTSATINSNLTVNGATLTAKNVSLSGSVNNAFIGDMGHTNWAGFSHKDAKGTGSYGLLQSSNGLYTLINKAPGDGFIGFRVNNQDKMVILNNGNVGIGTTKPIANLDISSGQRTYVSQHPASVSGLYVTGNFGKASSGVEFRHANGSQGIGFGYNTIYATGYASDQDLNLMPRGNGKVGVGTVDPQALLHVATKNTNYDPGLVRGMAYPNNDNWNNILKHNYNSYKKSRQISIVAEGDIISKSGVFSASDIRIKKNIRPTSASEDLQSLKAIEIVNYQKIDRIADSRIYKKVIAQQVQEVYPLAVQQATRSFIPSVFQPSLSIDKVNEGEYRLSVAEEHQLAENDLVDLKCFPDNTSVTATVSKVISPTEFVVTSETDLGGNESIFVYGKQVDDLLSVDYDAISMLNVSATQELAKQTEALQAENKALKARIAALERQVESLEELKASVAQLQLLLNSEAGLGAN